MNRLPYRLTALGINQDGWKWSWSLRDGDRVSIPVVSLEKMLTDLVATTREQCAVEIETSANEEGRHRMGRTALKIAARQIREKETS